MVDNKQFIICKDEIDRKDFHALALDQGYVLYYHKALKVRKTKDYVLIGLAFSISPDYPVGENLPNPLEEQIRMWGGRFIVYQNGRIYTDATKSLGIFYLTESGVRVISSSIHLLTEIYHLERRNDFELNFEPGGIASDFYPGPCTPFAGIRRLMQYEKVDFFSDHFISEDKTEWSEAYKKQTAKQLTEQLIQYVTHMMKEVKKEYSNVYVPLTGGWDSRCVGAICKKADILFSTYTELRSKESHKVKFTKGDRELPRLVAEAWNVEWELYGCDDKNENRLQEIVEHSAGMIRNANLFTYAYNQYPQDGGIILHGSVWELSREFYGNSVSGDYKTIHGQEKNLRNWLGAMLNVSDVHRESMQIWMKDVRTKGSKSMKWFDRFYFDQRLGCWLSDLNQALDLIAVDRISPINNYEVISILMAYPEKVRKRGEHQKMIIHMCTPEVERIPVNPKPFKKRVKESISRCMHNCKRTVAGMLVKN